MARFSYSDVAVPTNLTAPINSGALLLSVGSTAGFPDTTIGPFVITVDPDTGTEEKMLCSAYTSTTITVITRGYGGTSAVGHGAGATGQLIHSFDATQYSLHDAFVAAVGTVTPSSSAPGDTAVDGASGKPADALHRHAREAVTTVVGQVLAQVQYGPGTPASGTFTNPLTALDTTNLTIGPVTVPSSGQLRFQASLKLTVNPTGSSVLSFGTLAFLDHTSGAHISPEATMLLFENSVSIPDQQLLSVRVSYDAIATGLTPGDSLQFDLAGHSVGAFPAEWQADSGLGGQEQGPALMTIYAA